MIHCNRQLVLDDDAHGDVGDPAGTVYTCSLPLGLHRTHEDHVARRWYRRAGAPFAADVFEIGPLVPADEGPRS